MLRTRAHEAYIVDIKQKDDVVVFTMFERAPIDPAAIPGVIEKHKPYVQFQADVKRPAFLYFYKKNSRIRPKDMPEILMNFVKELQGLSKTTIMDTLQKK